MKTTTASTSHTPGPWNVEHPFNEPGVYVAAPSTNLVCKLYPVDGRYVGDRIEHIEANARLIAAAPELLERLHEVAESADNWADCSDWAEALQVWKEVAARCRAAIAKATGEEYPA